MKKKLIPALLITAVLTATLSGCSTKPEIPASPPTKSKEDTTKDVAATKEAPTEAPTEADNTPVVAQPSDLKYEFDDKVGGMVIKGYTGSNTSVEFPSNLDDCFVGGIVNEGYFTTGTPSCSYSGVKEIIIPNGVGIIEYYSFYGCTDLTSVTLPDSIYLIDDNAFEGCTNLTNITFKGNTYSYRTLDSLFSAISSNN